jgi:hypothetical protein
MHRTVKIIFCLLLLPAVAWANAIVPNLEGTGTQWSLLDWPDTTPDIYFINTNTPTTARSELNCATDPRNLNFNNCGTDWKAYTSGLQTAMEQSGARVVVFERSGVINWTSGYQINIDGADSDAYLYVAGATAPNPGITLRNVKTFINSHNVFLQHLRFRVGDETGFSADQRDAIEISQTHAADGDIYNVVIDHCSLSWSIDGLIDIKSLDSTNNTYDVTISNSILGEALEDSLHSNGEHSFASVVADILGVTFYRNFWVHIHTRVPQLFTSSSIADTQVILTNNFYYNISGPTHTAGAGSQSTGDFYVNIQGNVYEDGFDSSEFGDYDYAFIANGIDASGTDELFLGIGNKRVDCIRYSSDPSDCFADYSSGQMAEVGSATFTTSPLTVLDHTETKSHVLANAGAYPAFRDGVDERLVSDATNDTGYQKNCVDLDGGNPSCDSYDEVVEEAGDGGSGWNQLSTTQKSRQLTLPNNPHTNSGNGYTNLEVWLQGYASAVEPGTIKGVLVD